MTTLTLAMPPPRVQTPSAAERALFERRLGEVLPVVRATLSGALGVSREDPDVDDAVAEVMRRAWEGRSRLHDRSALRPWILGIARHVAIDTLRRRSRERRRRAGENQGYDHEYAGDVFDTLADDTPGADERLHELRLKARMHEVMTTLPPGTREAMILVHVDGLGYQQVADRLGVPLGTVATWISRGRRAVVAALRGER